MAKKPKLKLYVFTGFSPDYSGGLAFAIARDEAQAREEIEEDRGYEVYDWGDLHIHEINKPISYSVCGGS